MVLLTGLLGLLLLLQFFIKSCLFSLESSKFVSELSDLVLSSLGVQLGGLVRHDALVAVEFAL